MIITKEIKVKIRKDNSILNESNTNINNLFFFGISQKSNPFLSNNDFLFWEKVNKKKEETVLKRFFEKHILEN